MVLCWIKGACRHSFRRTKTILKVTTSNGRASSAVCQAQDQKLGTPCQGTSSRIPRPGLGMRLELLWRRGHVSLTHNLFRVANFSMIESYNCT